ncbi:Chromosome transmission fidelity protein 18-like protein [Psilocybe cubensis]|uniref:AAA+ ATPase domain-containing protein n=2 Tax=Psilocybe cubensis TaxID=181762 RepID=A0A8H8CLW9_PSICU|nr:Chromosome transmission fidelity protein 18-like protein [Psilocybe cubensis]KAH9483909.1 Chromosome transmission fidelity protein 18-like protein [Psilocybe cubensis]
MFTATGLLSGPDISPLNQDTPVKPSVGTTFVSNGLLGVTSSTTLDATTSSHLCIEELSETGRLPVDMGFVSNELLGFNTSSTISHSTDAEHVPQTVVNTSILPPGATFVSNGLLGNNFSSLPQTQDIASSSNLYLNSTQAAISIPRASIRATTYDGKTLYLKRKPKRIGAYSASIPSTRSIGNLLDVPIHRLMDHLSTDAINGIQQSSKPSEVDVEDTLWVDRYRPRKFTDLLGNEKVARDAMTWLKQWDYCVFGKTKGKKRGRDDEENVILDEHRRPQEKILLLSGPPGLGKTTMAHVIARQAGYEVMEINASDARSGSVIDDRIRPALESGSTVGSTKPTLLVIDEVDGATGAGDNSNSFIHKLVQMVNTKPRKKANGKEKDGRRPILRPIICICNDHNASSLAKLRPHTYQIRFNRPSDTHLVKRLKEICLIEDMKADTRALNTLVSVAKGDLRGCLNTLQFIKTRREEVTESIVRRATAGMKEEDATVHSALNNLFTPLTKRRLRELGLSDEEDLRYVSRLAREIDSTGRENTVATGCFGHYVTLRRHDANLSRQQKGIEWLATFDSFSSAMYSDGDFALNQYLPYTLVPFYPLFQEKSGDRVERNQTDWEHLLLTRSNEEIYRTLSRCVQNAAIRYGGDFRHLVSSPILQTEFAPFINRIISPPLRPVNSQVIRPEEKTLMTRVVDIMSTLELRFVQEKTDDGQLTYRLDPPIDVFITYDGKRAPDITVSRYAVRQLVSGEIDAKMIALNTEYIEKGKRGKHDFLSNSGNDASRNVKLDDNSDSPNKRAKTADNRDIADKPPTDFFGRLITVASANATKAAVRKNVEKRYRVTFRFLEGNSAAVRRPVKVNMFF